MRHFCLSVDVEQDLPGILPRGTKGIEQGLPALLRLLQDLGLHADFFFLGSVVQAHPDAVHDVVRRGHGIGNHGLDHDYLCAKSPERQRYDIAASTRILADAAGTRPPSFRAPNFSADHVTLDLLDQAGYVVDSSILPGRHARHRFRTIFDHRGAATRPHHPRIGDENSRPMRLLEIPVTGNPLRPGAPLGLGAVNMYGPEKLSEVARSLMIPVVVFLIHPWELVDLASAYEQVPAGYARACSSSLQPLRKFLEERH
jgi:peptidoglycan/xylan/chitin deacetylase (PgdA/CDA1 family)